MSTSTSTLGRSAYASWDPSDLGDDPAWCRLLIDAARTGRDRDQSHTELAAAGALTRLPVPEICDYLLSGAVDDNRMRSLLAAQTWEPAVLADLTAALLRTAPALTLGLLANGRIDDATRRDLFHTLLRNHRATLKRHLASLAEGANLPEWLWDGVGRLLPLRDLWENYYMFSVEVLVWRVTATSTAPPTGALTAVLMRPEVTDRHRTLVRRHLYRHQIEVPALLADLLTGLGINELLTRHDDRAHDLLGRLTPDHEHDALTRLVDGTRTWDARLDWDVLHATRPRSHANPTEAQRTLWRTAFDTWAATADTDTLVDLLASGTARPDRLAAAALTEVLTARAHAGDVTAREHVALTAPHTTDETAVADETVLAWMADSCRWRQVAGSAWSNTVWRRTLVQVHARFGWRGVDAFAQLADGHDGPLTGLVAALAATEAAPPTRPAAA